MEDLRQTETGKVVAIGIGFRTWLWLCTMRRCTDSGGMSQMHMVWAWVGDTPEQDMGVRTVEEVMCGTAAGRPAGRSRRYDITIDRDVD